MATSDQFRYSPSSIVLPPENPFQTPPARSIRSLRSRAGSIVVPGTSYWCFCSKPMELMAHIGHRAIDTQLTDSIPIYSTTKPAREAAEIQECSSYWRIRKAMDTEA